jgi:hypothetical protein
MIVSKEHPLKILEVRYPQIQLPIKQDMSKSEIYKRIVHLGQPIPSEYIDTNFSFSDKDFMVEETFKCGVVTVFFLFEREDFERFIQKIAYKCEPKTIPKSMGAINISGLNNWVKIRNGFQDNSYESPQKKDSQDNCCDNLPNYDIRNKQADFLSNKENYKDSIIVLSHGYYSGLDYTYTEYTANQWIQKSFTIRKYHELTHFICRKKYLEFKDTLFDEIFADCIGIIFALGYYDDILAKRFLGIEGESYKQGMRLESYLKDGEEIFQLKEKARKLIIQLKSMKLDLSLNSNELENYIDDFYPKLFYFYSEIVT